MAAYTVRLLRRPSKHAADDRDRSHGELTDAHARNPGSARAVDRSRLPSFACHPDCASIRSEAIMITSSFRERRIVFVNAAFARLTGFDAQDWIGRSGDLLQADGPLRMEALLWLDTDSGWPEVHWIARMHRRDGTPFCAEAHLHPMRAEDRRGRARGAS